MCDSIATQLLTDPILFYSLTSNEIKDHDAPALAPLIAKIACLEEIRYKLTSLDHCYSTEDVGRLSLLLVSFSACIKTTSAGLVVLSSPGPRCGARSLFVYRWSGYVAKEFFFVHLPSRISLPSNTTTLVPAELHRPCDCWTLAEK